jgi:spore germination protein PA
MPAIVGNVSVINLGSSAVFHIGDVFTIRPLSFSRTFAGAGSFNVGQNISVYNYQNTTSVNDSDIIDQPITQTL